jgi:formamidopyrimidine-DNA glycosylase
MPELPEVEVVRRDLSPVVEGRTIVAVEVGHDRAVRRAPSRAEFTDDLTGRAVAGVDRVGKFLVVRLAGPGGAAVVVHLGMSGQLRVVDPPDVARRVHTHVVWTLEDGREVHFVDPRTFGQMWIAPAAGGRPDALAHLGPDALDELTEHGLACALAGRRVAVKTRLMDQTALAGLGNIYTDEILFLAGVAPTRPSGTLAGDEIRTVVGATRSVLRAAIAARGSTLADAQYVDARGRPGTYQHQHAVHARAGEPCRRCGATLTRLRMGGRTASYCPGCQR